MQNSAVEAESGNENKIESENEKQNENQSIKKKDKCTSREKDLQNLVEDLKDYKATRDFEEQVNRTYFPESDASITVGFVSSILGESDETWQEFDKEEESAKIGEGDETWQEFDKEKEFAMIVFDYEEGESDHDEPSSIDKLNMDAMQNRIDEMFADPRGPGFEQEDEKEQPKWNSFWKICAILLLISVICSSIVIAVILTKEKTSENQTTKNENQKNLNSIEQNEEKIKEKVQENLKSSHSDIIMSERNEDTKKQHETKKGENDEKHKDIQQLEVENDEKYKEIQQLKAEKQILKEADHVKLGDGWCCPGGCDVNDAGCKANGFYKDEMSKEECKTTCFDISCSAYASSSESYSTAPNRCFIYGMDSERDGWTSFPQEKTVVQQTSGDLGVECFIRKTDWVKTTPSDTIIRRDVDYYPLAPFVFLFMKILWNLPWLLLNWPLSTLLGFSMALGVWLEFTRSLIHR